jgi:hypothetical protein
LGEYAKRQTKLLYLSSYIQNNNGTGPELANQGAFGVKKALMRMEI